MVSVAMAVAVQTKWRFSRRTHFSAVQNIFFNTTFFLTLANISADFSETVQICVNAQLARLLVRTFRTRDATFFQDKSVIS